MRKVVLLFTTFVSSVHTTIAIDRIWDAEAGMKDQFTTENWSKDILTTPRDSAWIGMIVEPKITGMLPPRPLKLEEAIC